MRDRRPQHKPQRDTKKAREVTDLRRQVHRLEREVARLRKTAAKVIERDVATQADPDPMEEAPPPGPKLETCPCGGGLRLVSTPVGTFSICEACKARVKLAA